VKGIVISGTGSGVGKTSVTTGLLSRLSRTMRVQAYKVGPDFIDPMYHTAVTGRTSRNLDSFMMSRDVIRNLVGFSSKGADLCVVEGVRGLYEGLTGTSDECSTAEMAKMLGFPVILVVNARSLTRSAAAIINGFRSFDRDVNIKGVILNNVSGRNHELKLRDALERYTDVNVVGIVRRNAGAAVGERRQGLVTEYSRDKKKTDAMEDLVSEIDVNMIMDAAGSADAVFPENAPYTEREAAVKVAVPADDAFCFYYRENIECMQASGAKVITFRPCDGDSLPDADIYYLGGGYPELHPELSQNKDLTEGLRNASEEGRIVIGEGGGMMAMCRSVASEHTKIGMSGIFDADARITKDRHGPSYVVASPTSDNPLFKSTVRGHEFHYSEIVTDGGVRFGFSMARGEGMRNGMDGMIVRNSIGSYFHQHALSSKDWFGPILERLSDAD
jgi:cobyrinic acid a,c-diamide synthase